MAKEKTLKGSMKMFGWLFGLLAMPLVTGCAVSLDRSIALPKAPILDEHKVSIAVLPFETVQKPVDLSDDPEAAPQKKDFDENIRNFEKKYFAARLVETLAKSPYVKEAYVSPVMTPSVDYIVKGSIIQSDGEDTKVSITLTRCCWSDAFTETFSMDLALSHFEKSDDPGSQLWVDPVNKIGEILEKAGAEQRNSIKQERILGYLGNGTSPAAPGPVSSKALRTVDKAAGWERSELLDRVSKMTLGFADELKPTYVDWQKKSTKLWEEKRQAQLQAGLNMFAALTSFGVGMAGASMGMTNLAQPMSNAFGLGVVGAMQSGREASIISQSMSRITGSFSEEVEPLTINLGNQVYTLTGSMDSRIAKVKEIVRSVILSELGQ